MARIVKLDNPKSGPARYRIRVFNGSDANGKKVVITETVVGEQRAKDRAAELEAAKSKGALAAPSRERLAAYMIRWLDDVKKMELRPRTWDDYRGIVARYIEHPPKGAPRVGLARLDKLAVGVFDPLYAHMHKPTSEGGMGLSVRTVRYLHSVLRHGLSHAVKVGALARNPTDFATLPKKSVGPDGEGKKANAMSEEEAGRFLEAARGDRYFALWAVLLTGGLRPGEAFGLTWADVDLEEGRVHVRRALTRRGLPEGETWRLMAPKTKRARRSVVLPPLTVRALREWRATSARERLLLGAEYENHDLVFATEFGRPLDGGNLHARNFRRIMAEARLGEWVPVGSDGKKDRFRPGFRVYDLRHTCATTLLRRGVNPKIVSERLGHASVVLTLDTYSHVLPDMQSGAADELEAAFGG
jgi:integrase